MRGLALGDAPPARGHAERDERVRDPVTLGRRAQQLQDLGLVVLEQQGRERRADALGPGRQLHRPQRRVDAGLAARLAEREEQERDPVQVVGQPLGRGVRAARRDHGRIGGVALVEQAHRVGVHRAVQLVEPGAVPPLQGGLLLGVAHEEEAPALRVAARRGADAGVHDARDRLVRDRVRRDAAHRPRRVQRLVQLHVVLPCSSLVVRAYEPSAAPHDGVRRAASRSGGRGRRCPRCPCASGR